MRKRTFRIKQALCVFNERQEMIENIDIFQMTALDDLVSKRVFGEWLKIYCPKRKHWKPTRANSEYLWDGEAAMSCQFTRDEALNMYELQKAPSYYVLPNDIGLTYASIF